MKLLLNRLGFFIGLLLLQILVVNHIHLMYYATPFIYSYLLVLFPRNSSRTSVIVWAFALGLAVDVFSNTPGMASGSMTLTGLLQPLLLKLFSEEKEEGENELPTFKTLGKINYTLFLTSLVFVQVTTFAILEFFSLYNWVELLTNVVFSTLLTLVMVIGLDLIRTMMSAKERR